MSRLIECSYCDKPINIDMERYKQIMSKIDDDEAAPIYAHETCATSIDPAAVDLDDVAGEMISDEGVTCIVLDDEDEDEDQWTEWDWWDGINDWNGW
jgi:hypothetical protein